MHSEDEGDQSGTPLAEVEALRSELVRIKEEKNLSLDAFAHDTQYSRSSWNRVLKGTGFPPRDAIVRLCARRRLDAEHLLNLWESADTARRAPTQPAPPAQRPDALEETAEAVQTAAPRPVPSVPSVPPVPSAPAEPVEPGAPAPVAQTSVTPAGAAAAGGAETVAVVQTVPAPAPAAKKRTAVPKKALIVAGLVVLLILGRWASMPSDGDTNAGKTPNPEARPSDEQPPTSPPATDDKPNPSPTPEAPQSPTTPGKSSSADTQSEPSDPATSAPGPTHPTTKAPTSAAPLGAEGRARCNYNSDRTQTMAKGMVGSKVSQLQCLLNYNYDNDLDVDGKFGTSTETAVRAVQQCSRITVDGQVGPQTWKYLDYPMAGCGH